MSSFANEIPQSFVDESYIIQPRDIIKKSLSLTALHNSGLEVATGLRREDVPALTEIARQPGTIEYCPNDLMSRWSNETIAEKQLAKDGGRAVFRLQSREDGLTYGFGWTGLANAAERELTSCENTFAIRLHERARGKGLATPFSVVIVAGSMAVYGMRGIGLETWASNEKAVHAYREAGANLMAARDGERPTLQMGDGVFLKEHNGEIKPHRKDTRLFMQYDWSF